jgi:hypothetical protein
MKNIKNILLVTAILSLLITGCSDSDGYSSSETASVDPYKTAGWFAKTDVSINVNGTVYSHNTAGVFGELKQSKEGKDLHDISGYGDATFQIVFPQTAWGDDNGDYFSNYKSFAEDTIEKKSWTFQLKAAHVSSFPISINLDGVYDVAYRDDRGKVEYKESTEINQTIVADLHLVDVDNAQAYTIAELKTAGLTMEGPSGGMDIRTFRWVRGSVDTTDYEPLSTPSRAAGRNTETSFASEPAKTGGGKFGLPPQ